MKITIERAALLRSLSHIQNVVERRTTIPILSNVKLEARDENLALTATDLDLTLMANEKADVIDPGVTTVSAHTFFDIVRKFPGEAAITLEQAAGSTEMTVEAGRSVFHLPCLAADEFPAMSLEELDVRFEILPADLARLIDKTRFAISTEETRYYLNGIHMHAAGSGPTGTLRGVATDGHRLSRVEVPLPPGAENMPPIIVPRKTVGEIRKLIETAGDVPVQVAVSSARIQFGCGPDMLVSRLIDGTFPDYERVIPMSNERVASLPAKVFAEAVDRVATISTEKARAVKLAFDTGKITISAVSADAGRAVEELDAEYPDGALEIGFNARYILDMMSQIDGGEVRIEMANAAAPTVVRDPADSGALYVLMPMRV
ncbi:DNA polymerase III, beta subunit [Arboricoccus pini]|uniref:Beta sliding clamp n=1 Tax=Arboricoccus pini TaxID=1963835 RepID=A0A212QSR3_9PROT|nr:DNA polymerase III subunit beta [Arboricoccus pini]SNB62545.1 DNA polymerase III, beta subunit [Arboricoccus pini]